MKKGQVGALACKARLTVRQLEQDSVHRHKPTSSMLSASTEGSDIAMNVVW